MTGAMFIAECLKQEGVTKVFGQCGHTNYALIDACHRLGIEYVSFRHEQMAAHAADAFGLWQCFPLIERLERGPARRWRWQRARGGRDRCRDLRWRRCWGRCRCRGRRRRSGRRLGR